LPHSEIPGSKRVCRSPGLIAAYHVLLRLPMPRHPSCALIRLTKQNLAIPRHSCMVQTHASLASLTLSGKRESQKLLYPSLCNCQRTTSSSDDRTQALLTESQCSMTRRATQSEPTQLQNPLWWACLESNQGPCPYQGHALTN
jgi:hypothetical protein